VQLFISLLFKNSNEEQDAKPCEDYNNLAYNINLLCLGEMQLSLRVSDKDAAGNSSFQLGDSSSCGAN
jgi:hypothetical protein